MEFLVKRTDFYRFYAKKSHIEGQVRFLVPTCSKCQNSENHDFWPFPKAFIKAFKRQLMWFFEVFWGSTRFLGTQKVIFTNFLSNFFVTSPWNLQLELILLFSNFPPFSTKIQPNFKQEKMQKSTKSPKFVFRKIVLKRF